MSAPIWREYRRQRAAAGSALLMLLAIGVGGCSKALTEDDLVEAYQESRPTYSADVATCVVGRLVDEFEVEGVEAELEAITTSDRFAVSLYRSEFSCGETGDVEQRLTGMLIDRDLEPEAATCVASSLVSDFDDADFEVLLSGELTDQFFDKYYTATYDCDALPG